MRLCTLTMLLALGLSAMSCETFDNMSGRDNEDDRYATSSSDDRIDSGYSEDSSDRSATRRDGHVHSDARYDGMRYDGMAAGASDSDAYDAYLRPAGSWNEPYGANRGSTYDQNAAQGRRWTADDQNTVRSGQEVMGSDEQNMGQGSSRATGNQDRTADLTSSRFVEEAASGGMFEVQSSEMALRKGVDGETREFAQRMVRDHGKANQELTSIARQRNIMVPQRLLPRHQRMLDELDSLSGEQFARRYRQMQAQAHDEAVDLFSRASGRLSDSQLRSFAERTLPTLRQHRDHADEVHANVP